MARYHIYDDYDPALPSFDTGAEYDERLGVHVCPDDIRCTVDGCVGPHANVFSDDELRQDGHFELRRYVDDGIYVGIPLNQYHRIFGDLPEPA